MRKLAVVGAGISGLSIANLLKDKYIVEVFEKDSRPGGLIKCDRVEGNLTAYPQFFIVGAQRSGTTLLRLILNGHSSIAIPEESGLLFCPVWKDSILSYFDHMNY